MDAAADWRASELMVDATTGPHVGSHEVPSHPRACGSLCCISAVRTQISLTERPRERIDALSARDGTTMAEVIRRAVDAYLEGNRPDSAPALAATFGGLPDLDVPSRDEWNRD